MGFSQHLVELRVVIAEYLSLNQFQKLVREWPSVLTDAGSEERAL
jgi:hypothetical protein